MLVFAATIMTTSDADGFINGNFLRAYAWRNAIGNLVQYPIFGRHDFHTGPYDGMSVDIISSYGITESPYLQVWLNYGIVPPLITFSVFGFLLYAAVNRFRRFANDHFVRAGLILVVFVFCNYFFGTFFGTLLTTSVFRLLLISYDPGDIVRAPIRSGQII